MSHPDSNFANFSQFLCLLLFIFGGCAYLTSYMTLWVDNKLEEGDLWYEIAKSDNLEDALIFVTQMINQSKTRKDKKAWTKIQKRLIELAESIH